jgi:glycosyltransferase involved in cell wall biosynthesis
MHKKILLGCYEVPGYGGASTSTYSLFEKMQRDGYDVRYLNIIDGADDVYFRYLFGESVGNPKLLDDVHNCVLSGLLFAAHPELADRIEALSPDLLVADGFIAALLMKQAAPALRLVFLPSGSSQVTTYLAGRRTKGIFLVDEFLRRMEGGSKIFDVREKSAVELSDLVITHSDLIKDLFNCFFPHHGGKVYSRVLWRSEWIRQGALDHAHLRKPFCARDIDLLFIASRWSRPEKNYAWVKGIVSQCSDLAVHIVGEVGQRLTGVAHHDFIVRRAELFDLMGRAKTVVCPSVFDAAPGILFEASAMGCNIVASRNCGNWKICNPELLVDPFSLRGFVEKARLSTTRTFPDNMDYFLEAGSYADLVDTLMVF